MSPDSSVETSAASGGRCSMKLLLIGVVNICNDAAGAADEQGRRARTLETRTGPSKVELSLLKRQKLTGNNKEFVPRKVVDVKSDRNGLVDGLPREIFDSLTSI